MEAVGIYQAHLDAMSAAMWTGDRDTLLMLHLRPHVVNVNGEARAFHTEEEILESAGAFKTYVASLGATAYHRVATSATFDEDDADTILGRHNVYILRGGSYVVEPYHSDLTLVLADGIWRAHSISVSLSSAGLSILRPLDHLPPPHTKTHSSRS